ncbi:MAG: methyltransferase domain-containing protein [Deltaproteobacteria bacterium]|nr:methyltransferase domain-containing protein [Candidatus Zymogenaceae bacterium]
MSNPVQKYIHGTSDTEQLRLGLLNRITNDSFIRYLGDLSESRVCDFGCGLGNLIAAVTGRFPGAVISGIEISEQQLKSAQETNRRHPNVTLIRGDALKSGLPADAFDLTYCRYLLEHVADPVAAVKEMLRVTRPGGTVACQENDLHNVIYYPDIDGLDLLMGQFCRLQMELSGDPFVGRKLFDIFRRAGASDIALSFEPEIYTQDEPDGYRAWLSNAHDILFGARDLLIERKTIGESEIDVVLAEMRRRIEHPNGVALFYWNRVRATKPTERL